MKNEALDDKVYRIIKLTVKVCRKFNTQLRNWCRFGSTLSHLYTSTVFGISAAFRSLAIYISTTHQSGFDPSLLDQC